MKLALLAAALALPVAAKADPIVGSFSGIVTSGGFQDNHDANIVGSAMTGTFDLVSTAGSFTQPGLQPGEYLLPTASIILSYDVMAIGKSFTFSGDGSSYSAIELLQTGSTQYVALQPVYGDPHASNQLLLTGPLGSLFTNINDLASVHAGAGVSVESPESMSVFQDGGATFDITSDSFGKSVPEPATALLLATPLLGLLTLRRGKTEGRQSKEAVLF